MEFKNLAEVELLGEVPEGASVLAATADGDVVRVPGDGLGGGGAFVKFTIADMSGVPAVAEPSMTFDEVSALINDGTPVSALAVMGATGMNIYMTPCLVTAASIKFNSLFCFNKECAEYSVDINADGSCTLNMTYVKEV